MASSSQPPPPPPPPDPAILKIPSQPSDIELAKMLRDLVDPSASPPGNNSLIINEADVYAQDPADLTQQFAPVVAEDGQKAWYFSTKLEPKSQRGKRKRRCMESGVWHDEGKCKPVVGSEGRAIGHRSLFSFVHKVVGGKKDRTGWIMHEFRLPDGNEEESPVVLCKVFRSSRRCATAEAQVQAQAEVEVVEEEALEAREGAVEAREAAVKAREEALAARESAVEAREALARRDAADLAVSEGNLQERERNLSAREAAVEARLPAREVEGEALARTPMTRDALWLCHMAAEWARQTRLLADAQELATEARFQPELAAWRVILLQAREGRALEWWQIPRLEEFQRRLAELEREFEPRSAELEREAELREAEGEALARRDAARLAVMEINPQERERNLAPWELTRLQAIYEELEEELEALVLMNATILMAARAGLLLLAIAGGSRAAAVAHCGGALDPLF